MEARCSPCRRVRDPREGGVSAPPASLCQCVVASARERSGLRGRGIPKGLSGAVPFFGELWRVGAAQRKAELLPFLLLPWGLSLQPCCPARGCGRAQALGAECGKAFAAPHLLAAVAAISRACGWVELGAGLCCSPFLQPLKK